MKKFEVMNRFTGDIQFIAEIDCSGPDIALKRGAAIKWAIKNNVPLNGADLSHSTIINFEANNVNFCEVDLSYSSFNKVTFHNANFWGAKLERSTLNGKFLNANFRCSKLKDVSFYISDLSFSDFYKADLLRTDFDKAWLIKSNFYLASIRETCFSNSHLESADFSHSKLDEVNFKNASIEQANFSHASIDGSFGDGITFTKQPIFLNGLYYDVTILDEHIVIGGKAFNFKRLSSLDPVAFSQFDNFLEPQSACKFWRENKEIVLSLFRATRPEIKNILEIGE